MLSMLVEEELLARGSDGHWALAKEPSDPASCVARGLARLRLSPPDPKAALADYERAVALDPAWLDGWRKIAEVLAEHLGRPEDSLRALDRALALAPGDVSVRAGRAVVLARLGRRQEARKDTQACLERDAGALVLYQAGCVYLLTADGPADRARCLTLLRAALVKDPAWARTMPTDPDLRAIHASEEFKALVTAAGVLAR